MKPLRMEPNSATSRHAAGRGRGDDGASGRKGPRYSARDEPTRHRTAWTARYSRRGSMKVIHGALIAAAALAAIASGALAQTPGNQPAYGVTYIEVTPSVGAEAANLLRRVAAASRKEAGNLRYE